MNQLNGASSPTAFTVTAPLRLLVIQDDACEAEEIERVVHAGLPGSRVRRAATLAEARRLLHEGAFEIALVDHALPDGDSLELLTYLRRAALRLPVVVLMHQRHRDHELAALKAGASDCVQKGVDNGYLERLPARLHEAINRHQAAQRLDQRAREQAQARLVSELGSTIASVKHEINNPLAIISGNAQLLTELAHVMDLDDELVKSIRDIQEASLRIAVSLDKLGSLKEILTRDYYHGDGSLEELD